MLRLSAIVDRLNFMLPMLYRGATEDLDYSERMLGRLSADIWAERWANRSEERRAANSPW